MNKHLKETAPVMGKVTGAQGQGPNQKVTINDPAKGIDITVPAHRLIKDPKTGMLSLTQTAVPTSSSTPSNTSSNQTIKPGSQISIQPGALGDANEDVHRVAAATGDNRGELKSVNTTSTIGGDEARDNFVSRMRKLAGL